MKVASRDRALKHRGEEERACFSIRVVSTRTGIPVATLRMWERRYGFPKPSRGANGVRTYGEEDVARLALIGRARELGYRPGDLLTLPNEHLARLLEGGGAEPSALTPAPLGSASAELERLLSFVAADDVLRVRSTLRALGVTLGARAFVTEIAGPLATRIGDAWEAGLIQIHQEHMASVLLGSQLDRLLSLFEDAEHAPVVVLATLPDEQHTLGVKMAAVYLACVGATPRVLGGGTPPDELRRAAAALGASVVGLSVSTTWATSPRTRLDVEEVRRLLPRTTALWIGGSGAHAAAAELLNVRLTTTWPVVDEALAALASSRAVST